MTRWRRWLLAGLVVWIVIVAWWALTPVTDNVPTGKVTTKDAANVQTAQSVECDSPLSGNTKPTEPLPVLKPVPGTTASSAARKYERAPCELAHENDRVIFAVDLLIVVVAVVVLLKTWKPSEPTPDPVPDAEAATTA